MNVVTRVLPLAALAVVFGGCAQSQYVTKTDFDATIAQLRSSDQQQQQQIDALSQEMQQKFAQYDARIAEAEGRIRVDGVSHFAFDDAALSEQDKPLLDDFAKVVGRRYPDALITAEGFTDQAGTRAYNRKLGQRRADAVRSYLVDHCGLSPDRVRAVSYGEVGARQVDKGKWGAEGGSNRRVVLAIDFAGAPKAP